MYHPCGLMGSPSTEHLYCRHRGRGLAQLAAMLLLSPGPCLEDTRDAGADQGRDGQEGSRALASHDADGQVLAGQGPKDPPGLGLPSPGAKSLPGQDLPSPGAKGLVGQGPADPGLGAKGLLGLTSQDQAGQGRASQGSWDQAGQGSRGKDAGGRDPGARGSQDVGGTGSTRGAKGQEVTGQESTSRGANQNAVLTPDPQQYLAELKLQLLSNLRSGAPTPAVDYEIGRGRPSAADMAPRYAYTPGFYGLGHPGSGYYGSGYRVGLTSDSYTYVR